MHVYLIGKICKIGIFVVCAQVLVHFRPNGSYEKYLKMLVSAMILLQMFLPLSNLFTGDGEKSLAARVAWFQSGLNRSMDQAISDYAEGERILEQMTLQEVQRRIAAQEAADIASGAAQDSQGDPQGGVEGGAGSPGSGADGRSEPDNEEKTDGSDGIGIDGIPRIKVTTQAEGGAGNDG
ncbi:MAG: stage III sporulation protein AF [Muribaculum sp.]|nr:stage III sporulation protein AF [Muribaculum sp.]